jgi:hypothetical protein
VFSHHLSHFAVVKALVLRIAIVSGKKIGKLKLPVLLEYRVKTRLLACYRPAVLRSASAVGVFARVKHFVRILVSVGVYAGVLCCDAKIFAKKLASDDLLTKSEI